jgi:hypothetical protein
MQAVALVTGDEFLVPYNLTIDADDVLGYIKNLTWKWFKRQLVQEIGFDDYYGIYFAEIVGFSGFCYSFNIVVPDDIFHLEKSELPTVVRVNPFSNLCSRLPPYFDFSRTIFRNTCSN